jgi:DNA-binding MarR family transcriptional regulator
MEPERTDVAHKIVKIIPRLMRNLGMDLKSTGLNLAPSHFRLLAMIGHRAWNLSELAEQQGVSQATMSNSVATLVEKGWVQRELESHDRRMVRVEITSHGLSLIRDVHQRLEERVARLLSTLGGEDLEKLQAGLEILDTLMKHQESSTHPCPAIEVESAEMKI